MRVCDRVTNHPTWAQIYHLRTKRQPLPQGKNFELPESLLKTKVSLGYSSVHEQQYCPVQCFSVQCCSYSFLTLLCGTSNKRILLKNSFKVLHYIVDHSFYSYTFDAFFDYLNSLIPPPYVEEESCVRVCQLFCRELCE